MKTLDLPADLERAQERAQRPEIPPWWPKSIGMGVDFGVSAADSEDWLLANWRPEDDWGLEENRGPEQDRESNEGRGAT